MSFVNVIVDVLKDILQTGDRTQLIGLSLVLFGSCFLFLVMASSPFGIKYMTAPRALVFFLPTIVLSLVLIAVVRIYAVPKLPAGAAVIAAQAAVPFVVSLILLPFLALLAKGNYFQCILKLGVAVVGAILITALVRAGWNSVLSGKSKMEKASNRTESINGEIDGASK